MPGGDEESAVLLHAADNTSVKRSHITSIVAFFIAGIAFILIFAWIAATVNRNCVVLISIDGFRPEYLTRTDLTPNLNRFAAMGIKAKHMISQFPTKTFPNHYSIITGLYPESHGIVSNNFFDPKLNESFNYQSDLSNKDGKWWGGEPIWISAVKHGLKAYTMFWPGSEAEISGGRPSKYLSYSTDAAKLSANDRVDLLLQWLESDHPSFVAMYFSGVDTAGHAFGPHSIALNNSLIEIDQAIGRLMDQLESRQWWDKVNIMIVSDHGMTSINRKNTIWIDETVKDDEFTLTDGTPVALILPKNLSRTEDIYQRLRSSSNTTKNWSVYLRQNIPDRFHFRNNDRIPPIMAIADLHYSLMLKKDGELPLGGMHGYDNALPDMHAIFMATGPAFKNGPAVVEPFHNIDVYNVLARILGVSAAPNNGSFLTTTVLLRN